MKKMQIFEPAMCCETGLCGVSVDAELLRISTVLNTLKKSDIIVDRFNLNSAPMEFVTNETINALINEKGVDALPAVVIDGEIVLTGRYPSNEELTQLLELPGDMLLQTDEECCCCGTDEDEADEECCCCGTDETCC